MYVIATRGAVLASPNIVAADFVNLMITVICPNIEVSIIFVLPSKNDNQLLTE